MNLFSRKLDSGDCSSTHAGICHFTCTFTLCLSIAKQSLPPSTPKQHNKCSRRRPVPRGGLSSHCGMWSCSVSRSEHSSSSPGQLRPPWCRRALQFSDFHRISVIMDTQLSELRAPSKSQLVPGGTWRAACLVTPEQVEGGKRKSRPS